MTKHEIEFAADNADKYSDLISRNALHRIYYGWLSQLDEEKEAGQLEAIQTCLAVLEDAPEVNAAPAAHGHWIYTPDPVYDGGVFVCSECEAQDDSEYDFCHGCGAIMDAHKTQI